MIETYITDIKNRKTLSAIKTIISRIKNVKFRYVNNLILLYHIYQVLN